MERSKAERRRDATRADAETQRVNGRIAKQNEHLADLDDIEQFLSKRADLYAAQYLALGPFKIERRAGLPNHCTIEVMEGTAHHGLFQYLPDAVWSILSLAPELSISQLEIVR